MTRKKKNTRFDDIDGKAAFVLPLTLIRHENWTRLTPYGVKLILDMGTQYTGFNNGYLTTAWAKMESLGWRSPATLYKAELECEHYGLITRTQRGGRHLPNLYAFTWRRIDDKPSHALALAPTNKPSNDWKEPRTVFVYEAARRGGSPHRRHAEPRREPFKQPFEKHVA